MIDATEQRELYFEGEKGRVPCMGVSGFLASPFFSLLAYDTAKISPSKCSGRILRLFKSGKEDACTFHETGDHASVECTWTKHATITKYRVTSGTVRRACTSVHLSRIESVRDDLIFG